MIDIETVHSIELQAALAHIEKLEAAMRDLRSACEGMPRRTPGPGAASTEHQFTLSAATVWALDTALRRADAVLAQSK